MKLLFPALLGALFLLPVAARADEATATAQPQGCGLVANALVAQGDGHVMIDCAGVDAEFAKQLAGILTYVVQRRLDPEIVIAKLDEIEGAPPNDEPRNLTADQGQALVQTLAAGKPATISISADPGGSEPGGYALAIATRLGMAGWQIEGSQIRRAVPPGLEAIHGLVLVVKDEKAPPEKAVALKKAMAAAKIFVPIIAKPDMATGAALLWVGKRPVLNAVATQ